MRRSRHGVLYAVIGFILVALVVVAGMTWATVSTVELAKLGIDYQVRLALWQMDSYVTRALTVEVARPYADHVAFHTPELWSTYGYELDPSDYEGAVLRSPLATTEPRYDWIELYFQVDQDRVWSSPQVPDDIPPWPDSPFSHPRTAARLRETFEWLQSALTDEKLKAVEERALACNCPLRGQPEHENCDCLCALRNARPEADTKGRVVLLSDYAQRRQSQATSQLRQVPRAQCVPEHNIRRFALTDTSLLEETSPQLTEVEYPRWIMEPLWLDRGNGEGLKIAFVRTGYADGEVFHQGFVGDWEELRAELLAEISNDPFPDAQLEPVFGEADPETQAMAMTTIPIRLRVPSLAGGTWASAWRSVRGIVLSTWVVTLAILFAAGWGVRNLLALTERRMQFAYAVTHELRTPLTTFRLYSDMLSAGLVPEASKQEYLDTLNRESLRLSNLVQGILEYARLENQKVRLNPRDTDAASLLETVREELEERCRRSGVKAETANELPGDMRLHTDVDLVNRVTGVLVSNACRHALSGKKPTVAVHLAGENGRLHVDVIDSGTGVARGDARRIFRPFRRGQGADAAAAGGIGLGLALARNWARLLGGRLDLMTRHHPEYGGAHFRLTIPSRLAGKA